MTVSEPKSGASTNFATSARPVYNRMRPISGTLRESQAVKSGVGGHIAVSRVPTNPPQLVRAVFPKSPYLRIVPIDAFYRERPTFFGLSGIE